MNYSIEQRTFASGSIIPTIEESYDAGFKTGLTWPEDWKYKPGGPWVYTASPYSDERNKIWAKASGAAHTAWMKGWEAGQETKKLFLDKAGS